MMSLDGRCGGFIPQEFLLRLAMRNPNILSFSQTIADTHGLFVLSPARSPLHLRFVTGQGDGDREIYDCNSTTRRPGKRARFEDDPATGDQVVDNAHKYSGIVRQYYKDVHNRNSIDAHGMKMTSHVHYGRGYNNAFWDGVSMTYGDGDGRIFNTFMLLDVTGHEISHGVTQFAGDTIYYGQAGALNESYSDVFGELIEQYHFQTPAMKASWKVGEGLFAPGIKGDCLRSMEFPGTAYNDPRLGKDPQPDHMSRYVRTSSDNGGVHINSGIPNRAFVLFAKAVGGYAWEKAGLVWYAARYAAGKNPSFASFAQHTLDACQAGGFTSELDKLKKAWEGVGVIPNAKGIDDLSPAYDFDLDHGHDH